ncbi:MAG: hypothetical protein IJH67_10330 [Thermoguttaceae bacterium]|nr:hypothetical protein [Thermoguttaceae bacterium]
MEKDNKTAKTESRTDTNHNRQSVWERFMTLYTCLLPIVVFLIETCHFIKHYPMRYDIIPVCECFIVPIVPHLYLPATQYIICVFTSIYLIPIILIILEIYNNDETEKNDQLYCKIKRIPLEIIIIHFGNQFHDSFIGEIIHIFLYFVMIGIVPLLYLLIMIAFFEPSVGGFAGIIYAMYYPSLNYIVPIVIALIFFYVLIRRIYKYKNKEAKRKKLKAIKRKELQVSQFQPDLQECFDEEKASEK